MFLIKQWSFLDIQIRSGFLFCHHLGSYLLTSPKVTCKVGSHGVPFSNVQPLARSLPIKQHTTQTSHLMGALCFSTFSDVAHAVLERCMTDNVTEKNPNIMSSRNYKVTFDFEFIEDWRTPPHTHLKRRLNRMNPNLMNTNISDFDPRKPTGTSSITSTLEPQDKEKQSDNMGLEREEEEQATKWKPEGLFKQHHPLNLMVGVAILSCQ